MKRLLLLFVSSIFALTTYSQATFSITTTNTTPAIDSAIEYTTDLWGMYLNSTVPIKINLYYNNLTQFGPLAITFANGKKDFAGAPVSDVWYATSLANSITSTELNVGEFDMDIFFNSSVNYYFGLDGNPPGGQYDFVSVLFHEIVHGLGGTSLSKYETGSGSFGLLTAADFVGFPTSFPFPVLEGRPSIWDSFLINNNGDYLTDTLLFPNSTIPLGNEFISNSVYFDGPNATASNGGSSPRIYAPSPFEGGSSLHHFNEVSFPHSSGNGVFTPFMATNEVDHSPGPLLLAALTDIGWSVNLTAGIDVIDGNTIGVFPNPCNGYVNIEFDGSARNSSIIDLLGNIVVENVTEGLNDLSKLSAGTYIIISEVDGVSANIRFVIE